MKKQKYIEINKKEVLITLIICLVYSVLGILYLLPTASLVFQPLFKGHLTLLVKAGPHLSEVIAKLKTEEEIETVITYETILVVFTNFSGMDTILLSELRERLDKADPRFDTYLEKISAYFIQKNGEEEWRVIFLKTSQNPVSFYKHLMNLFSNSGVEWYLYEYNAQQGTYLFMLFNLLFIILLLFLHKDISYKLLTLAGILPWTYSISLGTLPYFMLYLTICFYWALFVIEFIPLCENYVKYKWRDKKDKNIFMHGMVLGFLVLLCLFIQMYSQENVWVVVLGFISSSCLLASYPLILLGRKIIKKLRGNFHVSFTPISIVRGFQVKWNLLKRRKIVLYGIIGLFSFSPLLFFLLNHHVSIPLPTPIKKQEAEIDLDSLRAAALIKESGFLPDLSDYIIHIAYQEGLNFGKFEYKFPESNEKIVLSNYISRAQDNSIAESDNIVEVFNQEWCAGLLTGIPKQSLEKMLLEQETPVAVNLQRPKLLYFDNHYLWTIIFIWCIFLCPLVLFNFLLTPQKLYRIKIPLALKSKEL
jgi:hypothetical protein